MMMAHTSSTTDIRYSLPPTQLMHVSFLPNRPSASSQLALPSRPVRGTRSIHPSARASRCVFSIPPASS
ncbi:hypothetical protein BJV78DRAFT_1255756 [Lactifluus subvellereus]|nr:hypothetical protein BJV78DRAFT_1255756 [Lactifluus subvellereus]